MPEPNLTKSDLPQPSASGQPKRKSNTAVIVAIIGALGLIIAALIQNQPWSKRRDDQITVSGRVVDVSSNEPVGQADLTFHGLAESYVTEDTGSFKVEIPSKEVHGVTARVKVKKAGYHLWDRSVEVPVENYIVQLQPDQVAVSATPTKTPLSTWHTEDEKGIAYSLSWLIDPACRDVGSQDDKHRCHFVRTQTSFAGDNTPYDQWNLSLEAPGPVYDVTCVPTGSNEFNEVKGNTKGVPDGNLGRCSGWINGGDAPIRMTVLYKMLR